MKRIFAPSKSTAAAAPSPAPVPKFLVNNAPGGGHGHTLSVVAIQPKLLIGLPGDRFEEEAARTADNLLRTPDARLQRQLAHIGTADTNQTAAPPIVHQVLTSAGQPLDRENRASMERRFGHDFSRVRVHADARAAESAEAVNATAYTAGQHIVFGRDRYTPGTAAGDRLLAHELTHTLQQGARPNAIQRSLKFEIQTGNYVWAVKNQGKADPLLLPRKYGPSSPDYKESSALEDGNTIAYLSVGHRGGAARPAGTTLVKVEGPSVMKKVKKGIDEKKPAQFVKTYKFTTQVKLESILGKSVAPGQLKLLHEAENATPNLNTFEFKYINADGSELNVHLDEERRFAAKHVKHMKVAEGRRKDIDEDKFAQIIEIWKVTPSAKGTVDYFGTQVDVDLVFTYDLGPRTFAKGQFNPGTWEQRYFLASDFKGKVADQNKRLNVHRGTDGSFRQGHVKLMEKMKVPAQEQTAIEVQSEHKGFIEFETPKWFRRWSDIKARIGEAVAFTGLLTRMGEKDKGLLAGKVGKRKVGRIVEWPSSSYSTDHLTNLVKDERQLLIEIVDENWFGKIQASQGIPLGKYESLMKEYYYPAAINAVFPAAATVFNKAFQAAKQRNPSLDETRFAELKGFLQLVLTYIYQGQVFVLKGHPAKDTFFLMSRTNFGSMYKTLLSPEEQKLFTSIVNDPKNPLLTEIQKPIDKTGKVTKRLTRSSTFFSSPAGAATTTLGPPLHRWLVGITHERDTLADSDVSGAIGAKHVATKPGDKDYKLALFEARNTWPLGGNQKPASEWVSYAREIFEKALKRSADTPDDPTTAENEGSKTALKDD